MTEVSIRNSGVTRDSDDYVLRGTPSTLKAWVTGFSFFHCVASPFHSFVTTLKACTAAVLIGVVCLESRRDGWLVAWGLCGSMLIRFSTVWLLPFILL